MVHFQWQKLNHAKRATQSIKPARIIKFSPNSLMFATVQFDNLLQLFTISREEVDDQVELIPIKSIPVFSSGEDISDWIIDIAFSYHSPYFAIASATQIKIFHSNTFQVR